MTDIICHSVRFSHSFWEGPWAIDPFYLGKGPLVCRVYTAYKHCQQNLVHLSFYQYESLHIFQRMAYMYVTFHSMGREIKIKDFSRALQSLNVFLTWSGLFHNLAATVSTFEM